MEILDIIIVGFILLGLVLGFKRGFTRELVEALSVIGVIVLAYLFKNPLSILMYENLPFLKIGILKNFEILNILVYEIVAFLISAAIIGIIIKIITKITTLFEKILKATIILSIPSKLAGAIVGVMYHFVISFIVLYVLTLTCFDKEFVKNSDIREKILNNTPILSGLVDKSVGVVNEFLELKESFSDSNISENEFQYNAMELFLKYDVITTDSIEKLIDKGKIKNFDFYEELLNKYKEN